MASKFVLSAPLNKAVIDIAARYNISYSVANDQVFLFIDDAALLVTIAEELKQLETG